MMPRKTLRDGDWMNHVILVPNLRFMMRQRCVAGPHVKHHWRVWFWEVVSWVFFFWLGRFPIIDHGIHGHFTFDAIHVTLCEICAQLVNLKFRSQHVIEIFLKDIQMEVFYIRKNRNLVSGEFNCIISWQKYFVKIIEVCIVAC